ncbi:hypothetical protein ABB55_27650 [Prosthecomicrobium hirschii]|uniref:Uncharacterized protein n=1 Tax=Prosthecodimorpha hirschii TaxID=665126 RepID=A0A0P6W8P7_9HYPH|nr:hypothetical protein [Prosthecomicrobium hirschii]KPL55543.1 hypothetical protein ABB55_27650 [Prosthecomicrobium hirschii]
MTDPATHHGYALVSLPPTARRVASVDVILIEQVRPDGTLAGPFAGPGGRRRTQASRSFAAGAVIARFGRMPKPLEREDAITRWHAGRTLDARARSRAYARARRLTPRAAAELLGGIARTPIARAEARRLAMAAQCLEEEEAIARFMAPGPTPKRIRRHG